MTEFHNKIFKKLQKNKLSDTPEKLIEINIIKEIPFHEAFHSKPIDFINFFKRKLETQKKQFLNLKNLSESNSIEFETAGIFLKNGNKFYLTDFETTRQIYFEDYTEALYAGKIIICGVKRDSENYDIIKHIYNIQTEEVSINKPKKKEELEILICRGPFNEETINNIENLGDLFVFLGPFCEIKDSSVLDSFDNFMKGIEEISLKFNKKIILLPTVEDYPPYIFPQSKVRNYKSEKIIFGSNPFEFSINDFHFCYVNNSELEKLEKNHVFINEQVGDDLIKLNKVMNEVFFNESCVNIFQWGINYAIPEYLMHTGKANIFLTTSNIKTKIFKNTKGRNIINIQKTNTFKILLFQIKSSAGEVEISKSKRIF